MSKLHQKMIHQKHDRSIGEISPKHRNIPVTEEHLQIADRYVGSATTSFSIYKYRNKNLKIKHNEIKLYTYQNG